MLGKLLKYEMKSSSRTLLPLYIGTLLVAVICSVQTAMMINNVNNRDIWFDNPLGNDTITIFTFLLFFALCVAIVVLTAVIIIQRFNKNLIGDEGYLMFTLPVTHVQLLGGKLIAGLLWIIVGTIIMGLAAVIIWAPGILMASDIDWVYFWQQVQYLLAEWNPFPYIFSTSLNGILSIVAFILTVYLSIMIGQMEQCNKHRVAVSVVLFFIINWLFSLIESFIFSLMKLNLYAIDSMDTFTRYYNSYIWGDTIFTAIQCTICFAGVIWLMQKKLNL